MLKKVQLTKCLSLFLDWRNNINVKMTPSQPAGQIHPAGNFLPPSTPTIPTNLPNIHPTIEIPQKICYTKSDKQSL